MSGQISAIEGQKKNPRRINVYLDGRFAFGLSEQVAAELQIGQDLSDEDIAALQSREAYQNALHTAFRFLDPRPRTCWEMQQRLARKGIDPGVIDRVIQRLKELELLDDVAFAQNWIDNRDTFRPRSRRLLQNELRRKGIADSIVAEALEDRSFDDLQAARALIEQRAHRYQGMDGDTFRRKASSYLGRRGFSWDVVRTVMDELWRTMNEAGEEKYEEE